MRLFKQPASERERLMKLERNRSESGKKTEPTSRIPSIASESWLKPHPRFRLRKIMVAVDFSAQSEKAWQYGLSLAQEFGSELIVVHAVQPIPALPDLPSANLEYTESLLRAANAQLNQLKSAAKETPCSV